MNVISITKKNGKYIWTICIVMMMIVLLIPAPYYLYQPGDIEPLAPIVTVENGHKSEKGNFYLTTVTSIKVSHLYYLIYGYFAPNTEIRKAKSVSGNLTEKEYDFLLKHMMTSSQQNAVVSGLRAAGEIVPVQSKGVFVTSVLPISKAKGKMGVGDVITGIDGHVMRKSADVISYLSAKKAGETIEMTYLHNGEKQVENFELVVVNGSGQVGLGIQPEDEFIIHPSRKVKMDTRNIGGPSAGLMFSLEILNQTLPVDLTKGYEIAGTGTIDQDGNVGQIGGIRDKIVAAHQGKADIFFCPADIHFGDTNTKDVLEEAKKRGYNIKIVPVKTIQEATEYLQNLTPESDP